MPLRLEKYFTAQEINFITQYAQTKNIKPEEAVFALVREYIANYNLQFLNGMQVLALLDTLSLKLPTWMGIQLNFIKDAYRQVRMTSDEIKTISSPDAFTRLMELLKDPEIGSSITQVIATLPSLFGGLLGAKQERKVEVSDEDEEDEYSDGGGSQQSGGVSDYL